MTAKKYFFIFLIILSLGACLRFILLDKNCLWYDEAISIHIRWPIIADPTLLDTIAIEAQGLLYYYFLQLWSCFFNGISIFSLRGFSAVMNILTIAVLYLAGAALFSRRAALYSALILSLSPLHLWYSQEIRGYTLAALLALLSVVFLILALEREKKAWWGGFILSSLLALFTYYQMSVVLAAAAISLLAIKKLRPKWREFFISCAVILICFSPYALTVIRQQSKIFDSALNWIIKPPPLALLFTFFEFNLGYSSTNFLYFVSGLIIIWIFTAGLRRGKIGEEKCLRLKLIAGIISFTIILTFAISQIMPFYLTRYLFPLSALYYLLIGVAIDGCRGKYKKFIVILLAGIMGISCFYYYQNNFKNYPRLYPRYPFHHGVHRKDAALEELMEIFNRNARQGDILAISHQSLCPVLFFYSKHYLHKDFLSRGIIYLGKNKGTVDPLFIPTFFLATERYLLQDKHLSGFMDHFQAHVRRRLDVLYLDRGDLGRVDFKRLWLIVSSWGSEESNFDPGSLAVKNWCNRNLKKIFQERRENTIIFLYENTGKL